MKSINLFLKISTSVLLTGIIILFFNPIYIEINILSIIIVIVINVYYFLLLRYIFYRIKRITNDNSLAKTEILYSILFFPYLVYYLWFKDKILLDKYKK